MAGLERCIGKLAELGAAARMLRPWVRVRGRRRRASGDCRWSRYPRGTTDVFYVPRLNFLEDARRYGRWNDTGPHGRDAPVEDLKVIDGAGALPRFRAFPDDTGLALERVKRFARVGPILHLLHGHSVAGAAA